MAAANTLTQLVNSVAAAGSRYSVFLYHADIMWGVFQKNLPFCIPANRYFGAPPPPCAKFPGADAWHDQSG